MSNLVFRTRLKDIVIRVLCRIIFKLILIQTLQRYMQQMVGPFSIISSPGPRARGKEKLFFLSNWKKKSYSYLRVCHLNWNVASFRVTSSFNCGNFTCSNWRIESLIGLTATFFFMAAVLLILFSTYLSFSFFLVAGRTTWTCLAPERTAFQRLHWEFDPSVVNQTTCNYLYLVLSICLNAAFLTCTE